MKCAFLCLMLFSASLVAQQPSDPNHTQDHIQELQLQSQALNAHAETLYNKLRDLTEFQQYLSTMRQLEETNRQLQEANTAPAKTAPVKIPSALSATAK